MDFLCVWFIPIKYIIFLLGLVSLMGMQYTVLMPGFCQRNIAWRFTLLSDFLWVPQVWVHFRERFILHPEKTHWVLVKIIPLAACLFGLGLITFSFSRFFCFHWH